jgi:hypothetical protein
MRQGTKLAEELPRTPLLGDSLKSMQRLASVFCPRYKRQQAQVTVVSISKVEKANRCRKWALGGYGRVITLICVLFYAVR